MTEQLSLEENDEGALTANISVANWRAFMAPIAEDRGAVVKQPEALYLALAILDAFAQQAGSGGLSRAQVHAALQLGSRRWPTALIDQRLDVLIAMGFLEPYLLKQHQERYVVRPAGLAGALAAERLAMFGGVDELILLLDRARALIIHDSPDADAVYAVLATCRNALRIFALDLQRRIDTGTPDELIESQHQHDHHAFTRQVADLNNLVTSYFSGNYGMQEAATALIEAEQFYQRNVRAAADKVLEQGGASLNFDVLTPAEYLNAARLGDLDLLAQVGLGLDEKFLMVVCG